MSLSVSGRSRSGKREKKERRGKRERNKKSKRDKRRERSLSRERTVMRVLKGSGRSGIRGMGVRRSRRMVRRVLRTWRVRRSI
jgi:hypothetical protein